VAKELMSHDIVDDSRLRGPLLVPTGASEDSPVVAGDDIDLQREMSDPKT
jgi:hypothetical protein